jgi:hypothetical protein
MPTAPPNSDRQRESAEYRRRWEVMTRRNDAVVQQIIERFATGVTPTERELDFLGSPDVNHAGLVIKHAPQPDLRRALVSLIWARRYAVVKSRSMPERAAAEVAASSVAKTVTPSAQQITLKSITPVTDGDAKALREAEWKRMWPWLYKRERGKRWKENAT